MPELSVNSPSPNPQLDMRWKPCRASSPLCWSGATKHMGEGANRFVVRGGFLKRRCCRLCRHSKQVNKCTRKHWCFHPWFYTILPFWSLLLVTDFHSWQYLQTSGWNEVLDVLDVLGKTPVEQFLLSTLGCGSNSFTPRLNQWFFVKSRTLPWFWAATTG